MTRTARQLGTLPLALLLALIFSACDDSGDSSPSPTATAVATRTPTATETPVATDTPVPTSTPVPSDTPAPSATPVGAAGLAGLAVVSDGVPVGAEDALSPPPTEFLGEPDATSFSMALSHADWTLLGAEGRRGTTGADGSFTIPQLAPGDYTLELRKALNGNLMEVSVPVTVGDGGDARVLIEIDQGQVKTTNDYRDNGESVRAVVVPGESRVVTRNGQVVEVEDPHNRLTDRDGDGKLDPQSCDNQLWLCAQDDGGCGEDRRCQCSRSCAFCEDCGPAVCTTPVSPDPYRCDDDGACELPGDRCVCVSSCPDCDDCALSVCVPSCEPAEIDFLYVRGPEQIVVGRRGSLRAIARLDNGSEMDVTHSAAWSSSDDAVATVDSWGTVIGEAVGEVEITATFGEVSSTPYALGVVERPTIESLEIHIQPCIVPFGRPIEPVFADEPFVDPDFFPHPNCREVVRVGGRVELVAFATYTDGTFELVSRGLEWTVDPAGVGRVSGSVFEALGEGSARITARWQDVTSNTLAIRVVSEPTVVQLSIYPEYSFEPPIFFPFFEDDPIAADIAPPCFDCGFPLTVLAGDEIPFHATARYDTGEWRDVSEGVSWHSSEPAVAPIDERGVMIAEAAGQSTVTASLDEVTSNPVEVDIVAEATLLDLSIYQEGNDRVVQKGGQAYFRANGNYDVGFGRDLTKDAAWYSSDEAIGGFDDAGVFVGRAAGDVEVWAELDGMRSQALPMEVFEATDIDYCNPSVINSGTWSDAFNRVYLESDCAEYTPPDTVHLRFTVTERERPAGIFDPCLDLYVFQGDRKIRTVREEGCGEPFFLGGVPEADAASPRYQLEAYWDLKDDRGNLVPPGIYTIYGQFYLYFDPVVRIQVAVTAPDGQIPCTVNTCGNGCGYVHACGDDGGPDVCPAVCRELCECPEGWGITEDGGCEPCPLECCPSGVACLPDVPLCEPEGERIPCERNECGNGCGWVRTCGGEAPPFACPEVCVPLCECPVGWGMTPEGDCQRCEGDCCHPGETCPDDLPACLQDECCPLPDGSCRPGLPVCEPQLACCPDGMTCLPDIEPCEPLECCPPNARCTPDIPPCDGQCCPAGENCPDELEPCEPTLDCCPANARCTSDIPPCNYDPVPCCPEGAFCGPVQLPPCEPPVCCPEGGLCGVLDLPPCDRRCCFEGEECDAATTFSCESCCDPAADAPCIQGMPTCEPDPEPLECCPPNADCVEAIPPCEPGCRRDGCSGQLCVDEFSPPIASTCEFLPVYACYRRASCERQSDGTCGFTPSEELQRCIDEADDPSTSGGVVDPVAETAP